MRMFFLALLLAQLVTVSFVAAWEFAVENLAALVLDVPCFCNNCAGICLGALLRTRSGAV